jgi:hypothetical protein
MLHGCVGASNPWAMRRDIMVEDVASNKQCDVPITTVRVGVCVFSFENRLLACRQTCLMRHAFS